MNATDKIDKLLIQANDLAIKEVERLVRKIMRKNPEITGFCMAMGSASFTQVPTDDGVYFNRTDVDDDDPRVKELTDFIDAFNETLKITGTPMRIDGRWDAPLVTDW